MCKSFNIEAFIEPLVRKLSSDQTDDSFGKRRADKHFITFRSVVHDAIRDQLYCMCKSHRIESFLEPLLSNVFMTKVMNACSGQIDAYTLGICKKEYEKEIFVTLKKTIATEQFTLFGLK
ncbi:hypothetical protein P9112_013145 [Eukaryota sp. TZLM1-RC]